MPRMKLPTWAGEPGTGIELPFMPPLSPEFTQHMDYRWEAPYMPTGGAETPYVRGWLRPARPTCLDEAQILVMLDAFPPPLWSQASTPFPASSLSSHFQMVDAIPQENVHPWFYYDGPATWSERDTRMFEPASGMKMVRWSPSERQFADFSGRA